MNAKNFLAKLKEMNPELAAMAEAELDSVELAESMTLHCEQGDGFTESSSPFLFEENPELTESGELVFNESANTVVKALAEKYTFNERPNKLNISEERHKMYESIEREGQKPMYVIFEMPSGHSRRLSEDTVNRNDKDPKKPDRHRFWPEQVMWSFAEQIRKRNPVGYMGHATMFDFSTIPENIPVQWETAVKATRKSDKRGVTLARGYIYDNGMNRAHIRTGAINSASVFAIGNSKIDDSDETNPVVRIESAALISFDLVRKNTHGLPGTRMVAGMEITSKESAMFTAEQIALIAGLTAEQLKEHNPALYHKLMELAAAGNATGNPELIEQVSRLQTENVELRFNSECARKASEVLGCKVQDLPASVQAVREAQTDRVETAIEACVGKLKSEKVRALIGKQLRESGITDPSQVESKYKELVAVHVEITKEFTGESNLDLTYSESPAGGGDDPYLADWMRE